MVKRVLGALTTLALAAWITMAVGPMAFASSTQQHGQSSTTTQSVQSGSLTQPQPYSNADLNGTGANPGSPSNTNPYKSTRNGSPSMNGSGTGGTSGEPCAGCVGKADNKNPSGQQPGPQDLNNGYECDGNQGIAQGNPAHTTCTASPPGSCVPTEANDFCGNGGGGGQTGCVPDASNDFCGNGGGGQTGCVPDASNNFCSNGGGGGQTGCVPDASNNFCGNGGGGGLTTGTRAAASFISSAATNPGTAPLTGAAPAAGGHLAFTGSDTLRLAVLGVLLLAGGLLITGAAHRRRRTA